MTQVTAQGDESRRYLHAPEERRDASMLRLVLEASENPSQHRLFVYSDDELLGQLPAMTAEVHVQPGEVALLTFGVRVSKHAQIKSVAAQNLVPRVPRDPTNPSS